nr:MAG TPA: hypothetical protein [Caudoviricetes sp.]
MCFNSETFLFVINDNVRKLEPNLVQAFSYFHINVEIHAQLIYGHYIRHYTLY